MKNEALLAESDAKLVAIVRRELSEILGKRIFDIAVEPEPIRGRCCQQSRPAVLPGGGELRQPHGQEHLTCRQTRQITRFQVVRAGE